MAMHRFIDGEDRMQQALLPHSLEDYVSEENPVRAIEGGPTPEGPKLFRTARENAREKRREKGWLKSQLAGRKTRLALRKNFVFGSREKTAV